MLRQGFVVGNRTRWNGAASLILVVLTAAGLAACGSGDKSSSTGSSGSNGQSTTKVRIASIPAFGSLPLQVAETQGFFKKQGLDVTITPTQELPAAVAALGKQFDVTLGSIPILVSAAARGIPVQAISTIQDIDGTHPNNVLVTKEATTDLSQLKGKKVGVISTAGISSLSLLYLAKKAGVDPKQIRVTAAPLPTMADQVKAGRLDAAISAIPFFTGLDGLAVGKEDLTWTAVKDLGGTAPTAPAGMMITTKKWATDNPKAVAGYRKAISEAVTWIQQNNNQARQILADWTKVPRKVIDAASLPLFGVNISPEQISVQEKIMQQAGALPGAAPDPASLVVKGADQTP
jgi:NitT/TauT family transport system substrate-binding protein